MGARGEGGGSEEAMARALDAKRSEVGAVEVRAALVIRLEVRVAGPQAGGREGGDGEGVGGEAVGG